MNQVSSGVYQKALIDLKDAFNRYRSSKWAHPTFASRRDGQSFTVDSSNPKVVLNAGNTIKIPTVGTFPGHEPLEWGLVSQTFTLSKEGSRWFVSFCLTRSGKKSNKPKNQ
jgi:putative transposase